MDRALSARSGSIIAGEAQIPSGGTIVAYFISQAIGWPVSRDTSGPSHVPVIGLANAPGERAAWDRSRFTIYLWAICELVFVTNAWQVSSKLRIAVLRVFGAEIGSGVIFRQRTRVKFPWKLRIGNDSWIGEGVWFHNQDIISVGDNVVISQETMLTTGSHAHRRDMALITRPIVVSDGAWITSRCMILGGVTVGRSALVSPMTVVDRNVDENCVVGSSPKFTVLGKRFEPERNPGHVG